MILEDDGESGYVAIYLISSGCVSQGGTKRGGPKNVREAIEAHIEALIADGLPVPTVRGRQTVEVEVAAR